MHGMSETIGQRLRRLRKECRLSTVDVGQRIRMSDNYLRQVERGEHQPGLFMAIELAKIYRVSLDYIAGLTDRENNPYVKRI